MLSTCTCKPSKGKPSKGKPSKGDSNPRSKGNSPLPSSGQAQPSPAVGPLGRRAGRSRLCTLAVGLEFAAGLGLRLKIEKAKLVEL
jgi:hypothetical protein